MLKKISKIAFALLLIATLSLSVRLSINVDADSAHKIIKYNNGTEMQLKYGNREDVSPTAILNQNNNTYCIENGIQFSTTSTTDYYVRKPKTEDGTMLAYILDMDDNIWVTEKKDGTFETETKKRWYNDSSNQYAKEYKEHSLKQNVLWRYLEEKVIKLCDYKNCTQSKGYKPFGGITYKYYNDAEEKSQKVKNASIKVSSYNVNANAKTLTINVSGNFDGWNVKIKNNDGRDFKRNNGFNR